MQNNTSRINTVLLVIILLVIVGLGVWWLTMRSQQSAPASPDQVPSRNDAGLNVDVNGGGDNGGGSEGSNPNNP